MFGPSCCDKTRRESAPSESVKESARVEASARSFPLEGSRTQTRARRQPRGAIRLSGLRAANSRDINSVLALGGCQPENYVSEEPEPTEKGLP